MFAQLRDGGKFGFAQYMERTGQQHRNRAMRGHRPHTVIAGVFDMVGGQAIELCHQRSTAQIAELVGVQLHRNAQCTRYVEYTPGLCRRKPDALAKRIHRVHQACGMQLRQPRDYRVDIAIRVVCKLWWQRVCGQICGAHTHAHGFTQAACHPQHFALVGQIQSVTRFDLQGGDAIAQQRACPRQRLLQQIFFAGRTYSSHAGCNAATGACDVLVACAVQTHIKFTHTVAGKHQVGMAVDQARSQQLARKVFGAHGARSGRQIGHPAHPRDAAIGAGQCAILDQAKGLLAIKRGQGGVSE